MKEQEAVEGAEKVVAAVASCLVGKPSGIWPRIIKEVSGVRDGDGEHCALLFSAALALVGRDGSIPSFPHDGDPDDPDEVDNFWDEFMLEHWEPAVSEVLDEPFPGIQELLGKDENMLSMKSYAAEYAASDTFEEVARQQAEEMGYDYDLISDHLWGVDGVRDVIDAVAAWNYFHEHLIHPVFFVRAYAHLRGDRPKRAADCAALIEAAGPPTDAGAFTVRALNYPRAHSKGIVPPKREVKVWFTTDREAFFRRGEAAGWNVSTSEGAQPFSWYRSNHPRTMAGICNTETSEISIWVGPQASRRDRLRTILHEVGHSHAERERAHDDEEERARYYDVLACRLEPLLGQAPYYLSLEKVEEAMKERWKHAVLPAPMLRVLARDAYCVVEPALEILGEIEGRINPAAVDPMAELWGRVYQF